MYKTKSFIFAVCHDMHPASVFVTIVESSGLENFLKTESLVERMKYTVSQK